MKNPALKYRTYTATIDILHTPGGFHTGDSVNGCKTVKEAHRALAALVTRALWQWEDGTVTCYIIPVDGPSYGAEPVYKTQFQF